MARISKYKDHRDEVLGIIAQAAFRHGRAPSIRALAAEADVGVATMHSYLTKLSEEGLIEWLPNKHRSLKMTPLGHQVFQAQSSQETP